MQYTFITNPQYKYHIQNISNSFFPNLSLLSFILLIHKHTESNTLLLFFLFWASYFLLDQLIRKIKGFFPPSFIPSMKYFLSLFWFTNCLTSCRTRKAASCFLIPVCINIIYYLFSDWITIIFDVSAGLVTSGQGQNKLIKGISAF